MGTKRYLQNWICSRFGKYRGGEHRSQGMRPEEEMFFETFRFAKHGEQGAVELSATQINGILRQKYRSAIKANVASTLGKFLKVYQEPHHTSMANLYCVVRL